VISLDDFEGKRNILMDNSSILTKTLVLVGVVSISSIVFAGFTTVPITDKNYIKRIFKQVQQNIEKKNEEEITCFPQYKVHEILKGYFSLFSDSDVASVTKSIYGQGENELEIYLSKNIKNGKEKIELVISVELDGVECKYFNIGRVFD